MIRRALLLCTLLKSQATATSSGVACNVPELFAAFELFEEEIGVCPHLHIQPKVLLLTVWHSLI